MHAIKAGGGYLHGKMPDSFVINNKTSMVMYANPMPTLLCK